MEGASELKTLECLRVRLLAERGASRVANEEAEQMSNKLIKLEKQFRREVKSRNRAEKRLKSLLKKLESINMSYSISDESEKSNSSLLEKHEFSSESSSSSSTVSSNSEHAEDDKQRISSTRITNSTKCEIEELLQEAESPLSEILTHHVPTRGSHVVLSSSERVELDKSNSEKSNNFECTRKLDDKEREDDNLVKPICKVR